MTEFIVMHEDIVGSPMRAPGPRVSEVAAVPKALKLALQDLHSGDISLTPAQREAIESGVLDRKSDYLISTPTNSGKTLIAVLQMFTAAIENGLRSVYVVPLKALAEEKLLDFTSLSERIAKNGGPVIQITITTGDYQLTEDFLGSPPPQSGEIVICTPERLEVMLRNPDNHGWARGVGTFVIDEFHLLGDHRRGASLEILLTRIFASCPWSRVVGISATIGGIGYIRDWFAKNGRTLVCIEDDYRFPILQRRVIFTKDKGTYVREQVRLVMQQPEYTMLVFVYTKKDTESLVRELQADCGCPEEIECFHAGLSLAIRKKRLKDFRARQIRTIVTTTSLKMGVNLPVTHVLVRDHMVGEEGRVRSLTISDVLQMMGRAGRMEVGGKADLLCNSMEDANRYHQQLTDGHIDEIDPQLVHASAYRKHEKTVSNRVDPLNGLLLTELALRKQATPNDLSNFVRRTYSASRNKMQVDDIRENMSFLERSKLAFKVEGSENTYEVTKLGKTISMCGISPESGAMIAAFLRSLINLSEKQKSEGRNLNYLRQLHDLDLLMLTIASYEARDNWLHWPRGAKQKEKSQGDLLTYIEMLDPEEKPLLNLWRSEDSAHYPTRRLLSSLKIEFIPDKKGDAEEQYQQLLRTAVFLHRHSRGESLQKLCEDYGNLLGEVESGLKFTTTWLLNCFGQICDSRKCYNLDFLMMRCLRLLQDVSLGASLGPLLALDGIGRKTVERLIQIGITTLQQLMGTSVIDLVQAGIGRSQALKILRYTRLRNR